MYVCATVNIICLGELIKYVTVKHRNNIDNNNNKVACENNPKKCNTVSDFTMS